MGCNCKKTAENASKYTDDETVIPLNGFNKVLSFIGKFIIGIFIFLLIIVVFPFIIIYVAVCIIMGKHIRLNLYKKKKDVARK